MSWLYVLGLQKEESGKCPKCDKKEYTPHYILSKAPLSEEMLDKQRKMYGFVRGIELPATIKEDEDLVVKVQKWFEKPSGGIGWDGDC